MQRQLTFHDFEGETYIKWLDEFLGTDEIDHRLEQVQREIASSKGAFLENWVLPKCLFWSGIHAAREHLATGISFAGAITPLMERPMEIACKLTVLEKTMNPEKLQEFRSRILTTDYLDPVLCELDIATHFWSLGYEIEWCESHNQEGVRLPEFIARDANHEFEVECKAQGVDLGRRIARPHFYHLVDALTSHSALNSKSGKILITVPARLPTSAKWRNDVIEAIIDCINNGTKQLNLADGTSIRLDVLGVSRVQILPDDLEKELQSLRTPFAHVAVHAHNG